jgi:hypothetical protein
MSINRRLFLAGAAGAASAAGAAAASIDFKVYLIGGVSKSRKKLIAFSKPNIR